MTSRRRLVLALLGAAATLLVAGRFAAHETAERLWAFTTGAGGADLHLRRLALWSRAGWALVAIGWFVTHLLVFLRAIGSVQFPRRLGDLEIAEAVPRDLLVGGLVAAGVALGIVTTADTGGWWLTGSLAAAAVEFGVTDPHLGHDLGYYVAQLPWIDLLQRLAWRLVGLAALLLLGLYTAIGAVRVRERRLFVSDGARRHLAVLGVAIGVAVAWMAATDGAKVVAGLAGERAQAAIQDRILAATLLPPLALVAATATATWGFSRKLLPTVAGWSLFGSAWFVFRIVLPAGSQAPPLYAPELARLAFGITDLESASIEVGNAQADSLPALAEASAGIPVWDSDALAARYRVIAEQPNVELVGLSLMTPSGHQSAPVWRGAAVPRVGAASSPDATPRSIARTGEGATAGPVVEFDGATGIPTRTTPARLWFAPGLTWFAVSYGDARGIPLDGLGVRVALAWALQSAEVLGARGSLIWRRSPEARLERLAPFADFQDPRLVLDAEGQAVWVLDGYVTAEGFPGAPALPWPDGRQVRYAQAGLVGTVNGSDGEAAIYVVPHPDPVIKAWLRVAAPLIQAAEQLPEAIRDELAYPARLLTLQHLALADQSAGAGRGPGTPRPDPTTAFFALPGDSTPSLWSLVRLSEADPGPVEVLLAGALAGAERRLVRLEVVGDVSVPRWSGPGGDSLAGRRHTLPLGGALFTQQTLYTPERGASLAIIRVTWGGWAGAGLTREAALGELGPRGALRGEVPEIWGRMARAQALIRQADSLLTSGDFVGFAQAFEELKRVLAPPRPPR